MTELPLFPLSGVLLPHGRMPLRIFEQRYLDLVRDCMRNDSGFGVVWIRRGAEVAEKGSASPELGDYGTLAKIVDWDQLPDGLLGITIEGVQRFHLHAVDSRPNGLVVGDVTLKEAPAQERLPEQWLSLVDVLRSLEDHPHVQRMNLPVDYNEAWQVAYTLVQLLPLDEPFKYDLLGIDSAAELLGQLDEVLSQISGDD